MNTKSIIRIVLLAVIGIAVGGWFMKESNEGVDIKPSTLAALGSRGIALALDIYAPESDA